MSLAAIAVDIDEAADIALDLSSQVAFHLIVAVEDLAKMSDLLLAEVPNFLLGVHARLFQNLVDVVLAHAIKEGQSVKDRFISG